MKIGLQLTVIFIVNADYSHNESTYPFVKKKKRNDVEKCFLRAQSDIFKLLFSPTVKLKESLFTINDNEKQQILTYNQQI